MASGKSFGEWFKDVQEETEAAGAAAPNRTPLGGLTGWLTGSKPAAEEAAEDPAERQSLLPSFLGGGKPAAPTPPPETDWTCGLSRTQRLQVFAAALLFGVALMMLAIFVFLPMILFVPSKFALSFTLGSLMFLFAFAILRGPKTFVTNLLSRERLVFSSAYFGSIALTLFAALGLQSYLMVMISSGIQLTALTYHAVSYVPGGTSGLNMFSKFMWGNIVRPMFSAATSCLVRRS